MKTPPDDIVNKIRTLHAVLGTSIAADRNRDRELLLQLLDENGLAWNDLLTRQ